MFSFINKTSFSWLLLGWFVLQIIQAILTPIHYDEAYYWMYSQQLAWGYFDHPPAVALFIYLSDFLFNGILGVRFLTIVSQLLAFFILWKTIDDDPSKKSPFVLLIFCLPFFHILGFITTPDVPLILSACFYFYTYKNALEKNGWLDYFYWGLTMAALLYSKYHGVLLIFFTLLSNPKLFLNPRTYFAGGVGLVLWMPHLFWQFQHDFPSFRFHLQERAGDPRWYHPLEFLGNTLLIFNPLLLLVLWKLFKIRISELFDRTLVFCLVGFLVFFSLQTLRDHVQPQWIVLCYLPVLLLLVRHWNVEWNKKLLWAGALTLPLILTFRIVVIVDLLPNKLGVHRKQSEVEEIQKVAAGLPVLFMNSYKYAALHSWYSDQKYSHSFNTYNKRKNQFNFWPNDSLFFNKKVFVYGAHHRPMKPIDYGDFVGASHIYFPFDKLKAEPISRIIKSKDELIFDLKISNPYTESIFLKGEPLGNKNANGKVEMNLQFFDGKKKIGKLQKVNLPEKVEISAKGVVNIPALKITIPEEVENQVTHFGFAFQRFPYPAASILRKFPIEE